MSLAEVSNILKEDYKDPLRNTLNDSVVLSAQLERNTDSIVGLYAVIPMEVGREVGVGSRLENEVLPASRSVEPQRALVKVKRIYGTFKVTRPEIEAMATDRGSFERSIQRRMRNLKNACTREKGRQVWGDGSGKIATCGTTTASTTVQLAAATSDSALVNLAEGMQIDIGTNANPQLIAADREVLSVDFDNARIVISGAVVTTSASHFIYRQGAGGVPGSATQREMTGVATGVDDTDTLQSLAVASAWSWKSEVWANGGNSRPLSENLLEKAVHKSENRSGRQVDGLYAEDGVFRHAVNSLKARQRIVNELALKGGHTAIDYTFGAMSIPLVKDRDGKSGSIFGFCYDSMAEFVQTDWEWEDEMGGGVLRLATDRTHSFEAIFFTFRELGWYERNPNFRIDDLETA